MRIHLYILCAYILSVLEVVYPNCAFIGAPENGEPPRKANTTVPPTVFGKIDVCPYYSDKPVCCDNVQVKQMRDNFRDIDMLFGGDCPVCAVNLKILWCEFTCNPNTTTFIDVHDVQKVYKENRWLDALFLDVYVDMEATCGIFESCNKVPEVAQLSNTGQGFLQFQADNGVTRSNSWITFKFNSSEARNMTTLSLPLAECNDTFQDGTYMDFKNIKKCPCTYCSYSCEHVSADVEYPSYFYDFNYKLVLIVYGVVIGLAIIIFLLRMFYNRKKKDDSSNQVEYMAENSLLDEDNSNSLLGRHSFGEKEE